MTPSQLHEIDCAIARAMGKKIVEDITNSRSGVWIQQGSIPGLVQWEHFQPTRSPADAMEVLEWICLDREVTVSSYQGCYWVFSADHPHPSPQDTFPIAISLFAHKIITSDTTK